MSYVGSLEAQMMINEFFTKAECSPVALSHTNFPQTLSLVTDECALEALHHYLTKHLNVNCGPCDK